jgi:site-specific DNA-methyltransferase (adenine-specific)
MIERDTELQITSEPAIAYSTCYRLPFLSLFHADCMEIMKQYPDKYFDLAIVDPPYGIDWMQQIQNPNTKANWKQYENKEWDKQTPTAEYWEQLFRVSKNQIVWGGNYMTENLKPSPCWLIWDKMQEFSGAVFEMAWTSFTSPAKAFRMSRVEAYTKQSKIHPTQKPVKLYSWILQQYCKPNQLILDTHFGSGSIALAVDKANRLDKMNLHLTACEIDKEYIDKAIKRISESIKQGTLSF